MSEKVLTYKQQKAIGALIATQTQQRAAEIAGISDKTLTRWMKDANFQDALTEAIQGTTAGTVRRLAAGRPPRRSCNVAAFEAP